MSTWFTSSLLLGALLCLAGVGAGLLLLIKGLSHRSGGNEPHCARCDYNLTGAASDVCPECGTRRTAETTVHGERHRRPWLIVLGILVGIASCLPVTLAVKGQLASPNPPRSPGVMIRDMKLIIARVTPRFQAGNGSLMPLDNNERPSQPDPGMYILALRIRDKMKPAIQTHVTKRTVQTAALTELQGAEQLMFSHILPAYQAAQLSGKPEDAQALVPLMQQLDKHMDKLLQILQGY